MEIREVRELPIEQYYDEAVQNYEEMKTNLEFVESEIVRLSDELDWRVLDVLKAGMINVYEGLESAKKHLESLEQNDEVKKILEQSSNN